MKSNRFFLGAILLLFLSSALSAFELDPVSADLEASGPGSRVSFRVENNSDRAIAVQVSIVSREMDENGQETRIDANSLFQIYPVQMALQPGQIQVVRVQWRGESEVAVERAFRIVVEQLPINLRTSGSSGGSINILYRYMGTLYIVPRTMRSEVGLEPIDVVNEGDVRRLRITVSNRGNVHAILDQPVIHLVSRRNGAVVADLRLGEAELAALSGENVLAGQRRVFIIDYPAGLQEGDFEASLAVNSVR